jgi:perosamine synthetase
MTTTKCRPNYKVPYIGKGSIYGPEELEAVRKLLFCDETLSCGQEREAFEREFASFVGVRHALAMSNCTVSLELAVRLLDLRDGDNVIVSPQSYQSSANPLLGRPIEVRFGDIDANSLCLSPSSVERLIDKRTRAIIVTHYGGLPADMEAIMSLANGVGAAVIEDCAHALGTVYQGRRPGALGHIGCHSFQSLKNMSTLGQGGMITTDDDNWAERLNRMRAVEPDADFAPRRDAACFGPYRGHQHGFLTHEKNAYTEDCAVLRGPGTNATLAEPAAAVGRIQLGKLPSFIRRRREIAATLNRELGRFSALRLQETPAGQEHSCHLYTMFVKPESGINNHNLCRALEEAGIEIHLRYFPLHLLPEWRTNGARFADCPVTERIWFEEQVNLPIYPAMSDSQVAYMIEAVGSCIRALERV